jgi:HAD superfamily hydrolase (TIGR01549 family)
MSPKTNSSLSGIDLRGIVFDLDDTLILSTVDYVRFKRLIIEGIAAKGEDPALYSQGEGIVQLIGRFEERMRSRGWSETRIAASLKEFDKIMDGVELERVHETGPLDGAREVLEHLRSRGIRTGILTRGCQEYAEEALRLAGLRELVDAMECRNPDMPAKPNPEPYWHLVEQMGLKPEQTIFVGDHVIDATCASRAGVPFIGVLTGSLSEQALMNEGSVAVFGSVAEMLPWLIRILDADLERKKSIND